MKLFVIAQCRALAIALLLSSSAVAQEVMSLHLNPRADGIIGADDRRPFKWGEMVSLSTTSVGGARSFSTQKIVRLLNSGKDFICTGSVVGPTTILTAAHCLYWNDAWLKRRNGRVMFAKTWDGQLFEIKDWVKSKRYNGRHLPGRPRATSPEQYSIDVSLLYTSKPIASAVGGFLGITRHTGWGWSEGEVPLYLIGFHGDVDRLRPKKLVWERCSGVYVDRLHLGLILINRERGLIEHTCDSTGGSSGSPLLDADSHHIFGVHVAGDDAISNGAFVGAKQNRDIYNWLYKRIRKDRQKHGFRVERQGSGSTEAERYLTSRFQGPDDVHWLDQE